MDAPNGWSKLRWEALDVVMWTYHRPEGDIETWARTKDEAIETIKQHGFIDIDPDHVGQSTAKRTLADVLKKENPPNDQGGL